MYDAEAKGWTRQERRGRVRWAGTHPVGGGTRRWDSSPRSPLSVASPKRQSQRDCSKSQAARRHSTAHLCGNRVFTRAHRCTCVFQFVFVFVFVFVCLYVCACVCLFVCLCACACAYACASILHIHRETRDRESGRAASTTCGISRVPRDRPPVRHDCDKTSPRERQSMINRICPVRSSYVPKRTWIPSRDDLHRSL